MRIGGPADLAVAVSAVEDLVTVVRLARQARVPFLVLGGGSNLLVADQGVRGLVILNRCRAVRQHQGAVVWSEAGANLAGLARQSMRWGLSGLEWGVSVPGTVGGAIVGNAGAHGGDIADSLLRATLLMPDGSLAEWPQSRFQFDYRHSTLKAAIRAGQDVPLVLSAVFQLTPGDPQDIEARAAEFLAHRRATQPIEPSAGSIFQNPPGDYAGRILDSLGFKGRRSGQASFSTVHANFIVNHGGASATDVVSLIDGARGAAWLELGVELAPEILFVGQWDRLPPYAPLAPETP
jgi:UDP-N-acetylmuramate dehydrogenase